MIVLSQNQLSCVVGGQSGEFEVDVQSGSLVRAYATTGGNKKNGGSSSKKDDTGTKNKGK